MIHSVPVFDSDMLSESGIEQLTKEELYNMLIEHLLRYGHYLGRKEQHPHLETLIKGHISDINRKTIQNICLNFGDNTKMANLYHFMRKGKWDHEGMLHEYQKEAGELLSHPGGMLTVDGTDFPKKGNHSVGVATQYCGNLGKTENCQASVMSGYASDIGHCLLICDLYLPQKWLTDDYAELREECKVPENIKFMTKSEIALRQIYQVWYSGNFEIKYIGVDSFFWA
jgi:SRSO17 transposase